MALKKTHGRPTAPRRCVAGVHLVLIGVWGELGHVRLRYESQNLIADLLLSKEAAENSSQTKSLFLAGVSHDLKQPLQAIGLFLGVLRHTVPKGGEEALGQVVPKMESALDELHAQVSRLLELSRLQSGALKLQIVRVELTDLFAHMQALFGEQAKSKGIVLRFAVTGRLKHKTVWSDRRMLESIVQNLISNAIKNTDSGAVYVGVRWRLGYRIGRRLCVEVRDSGRGIPIEQQAFLFDAYRSFDDRHAEQSHGLGLAIAKAQAAYMTADLALKSAPGLGSVFTLCGLSTHNGKAADIVADRT